MTGKKFSFNNEKQRVIPKIGITRNTYSEVVFESYTSGFLWASGVYEEATHPNPKSTFGLALATDFILTGRDLGAKISFSGNINKHRSYFGIGLAILAGKLK